MRDYFEAWAKREGFDVTRHKEHGFYLLRSTHLAWKAFKEGVACEF